jgi:hypothetical protein
MQINYVVATKGTHLWLLGRLRFAERFLA